MVKKKNSKLKKEKDYAEIKTYNEKDLINKETPGMSGKLSSK